MEVGKELEIRLIELKVQYCRHHYFRAKSELNMIKAVAEEDYETAAKERDNLALLDEKIEEVNNKKDDLIHIHKN
jgi:protein-arginine kinase activator protein McsA